MLYSEITLFEDIYGLIYNIAKYKITTTSSDRPGNNFARSYKAVHPQQDDTPHERSSPVETQTTTITVTTAIPAAHQQI